MKSLRTATLALAALAAFVPARAAHLPSHVLQEKASAAAFTEGEVRKVDSATGKVTLRHGPIENLDMPAMTMVFRVADPALLASLKEGDKVRFRAERLSGQITVTEVER